MRGNYMGVFSDLFRKHTNGIEEIEGQQVRNTDDRTISCIDCRSYDSWVIDGKRYERCGIYGTGNCRTNCSKKALKDPNYRWSDENRF